MNVNQYKEVSNGMGIPPHTRIENIYNGSNQLITVTYKHGSDIVAVLDMTYDGSGNLETVTRVQ